MLTGDLETAEMETLATDLLLLADAQSSDSGDGGQDEGEGLHCKRFGRCCMHVDSLRCSDLAFCIRTRDDQDMSGSVHPMLSHPGIDGTGHAGDCQHLLALQQILLSQLEGEEDPKVTRRLLQALNTSTLSMRELCSAFGLSCPAAALADGTDEQHGSALPAIIHVFPRSSQLLLQRLMTLAMSCDPAVRGSSLCCLGAAVGTMHTRGGYASPGTAKASYSLEPNADNAAILEDGIQHVQPFLDLVAQAGKAMQPWQVRASAAEALQHSGRHSLHV